MKYVPVFTKDDNELFFPYEKKIFATENEALASILDVDMLFTAAVADVNFLHVISIDLDNIPHVPSKIGEISACVIAGPIFDEYMARHESNDEQQS